MFAKFDARTNIELRMAQSKFWHKTIADRLEERLLRAKWLIYHDSTCQVVGKDNPERWNCDCFLKEVVDSIREDL